MKQLKENRKCARFEVPLCLQFSNEGESQEFLGVVKNISLSGVKISVDMPLDLIPENKVSLFIHLPDKPLTASGRVIWVENSGRRKQAGVMFVNIPDAYKTDIYDFISKYHLQEISKRWWAN